MKMPRSVRVMICSFLVPAFLTFSGGAVACASMDTEDGGMGMGMGIPLGAFNNDADVDICPHGAKVIGMFLQAWQASDYRTMYELIDDDSKRDYPFEKAKFDFQFAEFKEYRISSVRRNGDNFEFVLSYGDWKNNDKETIKMVVDGESFKVVMPRKGTFYKTSVDSYF